MVCLLNGIAALKGLMNSVETAAQGCDRLAAFHFFRRTGRLPFEKICVSLLLSRLARRKFDPPRSSGQAVVTGVVPSPPPPGTGLFPMFIAPRVISAFRLLRLFSSDGAKARSR